MTHSLSSTCSQKEQKDRFLRRPAECSRLCTEPLLGPPVGWPSEEEGEEGGDAAARMLLRFREQRRPVDAAAAGARPATCAKLYACACRSESIGSDRNQPCTGQ